MSGSFVDSFRVEDTVYFHFIFCSEDDRVECQDEDENVILTFTANCDAFDKDGKLVGRWSMRDNKWFFTQEGKEPLYFGHDLLKAEVEVSKLYIQGQL